MIRLNFPQSHVYLEFDKQWSVHQADGLQLPVLQVTGQLSAYDALYSIVMLPQMLAYAEKLSPLPPVEHPDLKEPEPLPWFGSTRDGFQKQLPAFLNCKPVFYNECMLDDPQETYQKLLYYVLPTTSPLYHDYIYVKAVDGLAVCSDVTRIAFAYGGKELGWREVDVINDAWERHRTRYGYTVYTSGSPNLTQLITGLMCLTDEHANRFPVSMLTQDMEPMFKQVEDPSEYEKYFDFATNGHRLLYLLNTDVTLPVKREEVTATAKEERLDAMVEELVDAQEPEPEPEPEPSAAPIAMFNQGIGHQISCGGDISIINATKAWQVSDLVNFIKSTCRDYSNQEPASGRYISQRALDTYMEMFPNDGRVNEVKGAPDRIVPLQVVFQDVTYVWTGVGFRHAYGPERHYDKTVQINRDTVLAYEDGEVAITSEYLTSLVAVLLSDFYRVTEGTAALYYTTHPTPDSQANHTGTICIVDPRTLVGAEYAGNGVWEYRDFDGYGSGKTMSPYNFEVYVTGTGWAYSREVADILHSLCGAVQQLCVEREARKEDVAAGTVFGSYDILHTCVTEDMYMQEYEPRRIFATQMAGAVFVKHNDKLYEFFDGEWRLSSASLPADAVPVYEDELYVRDAALEFETDVLAMVAAYAEVFQDRNTTESKVALELECAML